MEIKPRPVSLATYFSVLRKYPTFYRLSILFILLPLIIILPVILLITSLSHSSYATYDYTKIDKEGILLKGRVVQIKPDLNTRINNQHPSVISYNYLSNGKETTSEFETLELEKVQQLKAGDTIDVKVLHNESEIVNLTPFQFPFYLFYFIPLPLVLTGIGFGIYFLTKTRREINLYKYGTVRDAKIISVTGLNYRRTNTNNKIFTVDYYYTTITGSKIYGRSRAIGSGAISSKKLDDTIKIFVSEKEKTKSCLVPEEQAVKNNWQLQM